MVLEVVLQRHFVTGCEIHTIFTGKQPDVSVSYKVQHCHKLFGIFDQCSFRFDGGFGTKFQNASQILPFVNILYKGTAS